jgi:hypothetical protein
VEPITRFSLAPHTGVYERWPRRTALLEHGRETGTKLPGYIIEGQYRCADGILLLLSYDCPFDETYTFLLLGEDLKVRARRDLGMPSGSFLLHTHWVVSENALRLHFYTRDVFTLSIHRRSAWWLPTYALRLTKAGAAEIDTKAMASIAALETQLAVNKQRRERDQAVDA